MLRATSAGANLVLKKEIYRSKFAETGQAIVESIPHALQASNRGICGLTASKGDASIMGRAIRACKKRYLDLPALLFLGILVAGAAVRFYYADVNSYWLDELYSVYFYGIAHGSLMGVLAQVAHSVQLPLYQFILYYWMTIFGDTEIATRSLSNLYIVGATTCLYLAVRRIYGPWMGVVVALVFTLMFTPTYYGLETRAYAQSLFLSSLSTLLLTYALPRLATKSWSGLLRDSRVYALVAVNSALMMTHYYNVLFLAAQGLFLLMYLLYRSRSHVDAIAKSVAVGFSPVLVLLVTWGPFMVRSFGGVAQQYVLQGTPRLPWETLSKSVIEPNFGRSYLLYVIMAIIAWVTITTLVKLVRRGDDETLFTAWFILATIGPAFLAFFLFFILGHERHSNRYFSFSVVPLSVLWVFGLFQAISLLGRVIPGICRVALVATVVLAALAVIPGGVHAVNKTKADWRGIARDIVVRINREPNKSFVVYETTFKDFPTLDYYLQRYSDRVRVDKVLQRRVEKGRQPFDFSPPYADYALVAFTHHRTSNYPKTIAVLNSEMTLIEKHLNKEERGYLLYTPHK